MKDSGDDTCFALCFVVVEVRGLLLLEALARSLRFVVVSQVATSSSRPLVTTRRLWYFDVPLIATNGLRRFVVPLVAIRGSRLDVVTGGWWYFIVPSFAGGSFRFL